MKPRSHFAFRIIVSTNYGLEQVAASSDLAMAKASPSAPRASGGRRRTSRFREGARIVEDSRERELPEAVGPCGPLAGIRPR